MKLPPLSIALADDEAMARQRLTRLLGALPSVRVVAECKNGAEMLEFLEQTPALPDVLLLDIRMPVLSGLEARALLGEGAPYVIFTTAHSEHALQAFDVGAEDYLLKPIEATRLTQALHRAALRLKLAKPDVSPPLKRLAVPSARGIVFVNPAQLLYAELSGGLLTLHTERGSVLSDWTLRDLQDQLLDARFWRVQRQALVNLDFVERLESIASGGYLAHLTGGATVQVSRQAGRRLRQHLGLVS